MSTWPHEPTKLTDAEKTAYRYLLYWAMLDIRNLCQSRGRESLNPFTWKEQYRQSRIAGALADWLHNLADHAATNFDRFNAEWFWQEHDDLVNRVGRAGLDQWIIDYRARYEGQLKEQNQR